MSTVIRRSLTARVMLFSVIALFAFPVFAQVNSTLESTIRAAILSDPRTAAMSDSEVEAMVAALVEEAIVQGMNSEDIVWRPYEGNVPDAPSCGNLPYFLCALNWALGFDGSDLAIPIALGVSSALLLFLIGMLLLRLGHHPVAGILSKSGT